jgi:hypothetical protein
MFYNPSLISPPWMRPSHFSSLHSHLWELLTQTLIRQTPTTGAPAPARTFPRLVGAPMGASGRSPSWRCWWPGGGLLIPVAAPWERTTAPRLRSAGGRPSPSPRPHHGSREAERWAPRGRAHGGRKVNDAPLGGRDHGITGQRHPAHARSARGRGR